MAAFEVILSVTTRIEFGKDKDEARAILAKPNPCSYRLSEAICAHCRTCRTHPQPAGEHSRLMRPQMRENLKDSVAEHNEIIN